MSASCEVLIVPPGPQDIAGTALSGDPCTAEATRWRAPDGRTLELCIEHALLWELASERRLVESP